MSGRFNIVSRNGLLRADSEDCERLLLRLYSPDAKDVADYETAVHVNLSDLRQIVEHFDWLHENEPPTQSPPKEIPQHVQRMLRSGGFFDEGGEWHSLFPGEK